MSAGYLGMLVPVAILLSFGPAVAQPCFTAAQCAQIRIGGERFAAEQQAAQAAQEAARLRQQHDAAKEAELQRGRQATQQRQAYIEQEREQARWRAEQAVLQAEMEQRAQDAALLRSRQQAEQQAAYELRKRQIAIEEENRASAQLAAENSPENYCRDRKTAGDLMDYFNGLQAAADFSTRAVDIDHLTTIRFDTEHQAISCHGSFVLQNGSEVVGTMSTRLNVAGRLLTEFHRD